MIWRPVIHWTLIRMDDENCILQSWNHVRQRVFQGKPAGVRTSTSMTTTQVLQAARCQFGDGCVPELSGWLRVYDSHHTSVLLGKDVGTETSKTDYKWSLGGAPWGSNRVQQQMRGLHISRVFSTSKDRPCFVLPVSEASSTGAATKCCEFLHQTWGKKEEVEGILIGYWSIASLGRLISS